MGEKVTELPVEKISADDPIWQRFKEWYKAGSVPENAAWIGDQPIDRKAAEEWARQFEDLGTVKGATSKGLAHILGPLAMAAPEAPLANAALQAGYGALSSYANDPEHKGSSALFGGTVSALLGGGASSVARGVRGLLPAAATAASAPRDFGPVPAPKAASPLPGWWSKDKVLNTLGPRVAQGAMGGKPQPIAARALERFETGTPAVPPPVRPTPQQVELGLPPPKYNYHATPNENLRKISELGLRPEEGGKNFAFAKNRGRVYMSPAGEADMWRQKVTDATGLPATTLRTTAPVDKVPGANQAVQMRTSPVAPERIQYQTPSGEWRSVKELSKEEFAAELAKLIKQGAKAAEGTRTTAVQTPLPLDFGSLFRPAH